MAVCSLNLADEMRKNFGSSTYIKTDDGHGLLNCFVEVNKETEAGKSTTT